MMKKINTTYLIALSALVFASCSESDGLSSGIPLSKEKIAFAATLQDGWNGGTSAEAGNNSRAGKPTFSGLAMEQKVLTANEGLAKPLYLHPLETENTSVMNAMPQTRGAMNESSTVGSFGVSAVYSKDGVNYSPLFQNEEATQNGNYWFTSSNATWPLDGSVSFYAYAPYNDASLSLQGSDDFVKNKTIRYTANTDDFSKQPDLIVAKNENNAFTSSTANKAVGLSFNHALTAITFSISADMIPGKVKSITVSGVYGQGDYDLSKASWVSLASPSTYVIKPNEASVKAGESKALTDKNSALMMIPQPLDNAKVSMIFNDGSKDKTVSFSLNGTWDAGKHTTYVLSSSKITTLNMGSLTYPTAWNSVNTGANAKNQIRTAYARNTSAGLFVVNEDRKIIAANVQLTYDGTSWSLPAGSKLKFSPKYNYFVYYPYQDQASLSGLPAVNTTVSDVSSSTQFFADAIATWKSSKIATDQSTLDKMNPCDLQIGKATLDDDGCSVSFKMEHAMGLAEITLGAKTFDNNYYLSNYPEYTWKNGTTTFHAYAGISGHSFYKVAAYRYVALVKPDITTDFSCGSTTDPDSWTEKVSVKPTANNIARGTATSKRTSWIIPHELRVGDFFYRNGELTARPKDNSCPKLVSGELPIGIVVYTGNNRWTENTVSGKGGHALVMALKTIGSTGKKDRGTKIRWYPTDGDTGNVKIHSGARVRASFNQDYGSGYTVTKSLIAKSKDFEAAVAADNHNKTLPVPSNCTGWFLASVGQYYAMLTGLGGGITPDTWEFEDFFGNQFELTVIINNAIRIVGDDNYTEFINLPMTWEWSCNEDDFAGATKFSIAVLGTSPDYNERDGWMRFGHIMKSNPSPIRPFLAF